MIIKSAKRLVDKIIIYVVRKYIQEYQASTGYNQLHHKIQDKVLADQAEFVLRHIENSMIFRSQREIQEFALRKTKKEGLLMEFGVASGGTINRFSKQLKTMGDERIVYGFDSFEGLREDYTGSCLEAGALSQNGILPDVGDNVQLINGWIQDTLSPFLDENISDIALIHVDTDTYETARFILDLCKARMSAGSLILFDQLLGGPNWRYHEYRAMTEAFSDEEYEFIAFATKRALVRLK